MTEIKLSPAMRVGALIAGALLVLIAVGIFAVLLVLQDSNDRIHAQDEKIGDLKSEVDPILDLVGPLVGDTRPVLREAQALSQPLGRTLEDVSAAAEEAPQLARAARTLVGESLPVVELLRLALPEVRAVLPEAGALLPELRALLPVLEATATKSGDFLDEAERRALLARADAAISAALHIEEIQMRSVRLIQTQLKVQKQTLAVQLEALEHIESLDAKTGGEFPPAGD